MVFFQKPYDSRIDAGFMFGFLRPGAFRCILRISGFFRYTGLFPGRSCLFPGFSGCLVCFPDGFRPRPAPGPVIERFLIPAFRHVGRQMSLACRCGHFPLL
ncbi:hypothetical protein, partial [Alistipes sp.]|uniref:hypothetical protein n=1 Tax=Alistipes sp. TaxID=1872444 RepID=UPI0023F3BA5A